MELLKALIGLLKAIYLNILPQKKNKTRVPTSVGGSPLERTNEGIAFEKTVIATDLAKEIYPNAYEFEGYLYLTKKDL